MTSRLAIPPLAENGHIIVRKEHTLCARCGTLAPIHPGDGTPMPSFITALELFARKHRVCALKGGR